MIEIYGEYNFSVIANLSKQLCTEKEADPIKITCL